MHPFSDRYDTDAIFMARSVRSEKEAIKGVVCPLRSDGRQCLTEASCSTVRNCSTSAGRRSMQNEVLTSRFETTSPTRSDSQGPSPSQPFHGRGEIFPMQSGKGICSRSRSVQSCVGFRTVKDPVRAVFGGHLPLGARRRPSRSEECARLQGVVCAFRSDGWQYLTEASCQRRVRTMDKSHIAAVKRAAEETLREANLQLRLRRFLCKKLEVVPERVPNIADKLSDQTQHARHFFMGDVAELSTDDVRRFQLKCLNTNVYGQLTTVLSFSFGITARGLSEVRRRSYEPQFAQLLLLLLAKSRNKLHYYSVWRWKWATTTVLEPGHAAGGLEVSVCRRVRQKLKRFLQTGRLVKISDQIRARITDKSHNARSMMRSLMPEESDPTSFAICSLAAAVSISLRAWANLIARPAAAAAAAGQNATSNVAHYNTIFKSVGAFIASIFAFSISTSFHISINYPWCIFCMLAFISGQ